MPTNRNAEEKAGSEWQMWQEVQEALGKLPEEELPQQVRKVPPPVRKVPELRHMIEQYLAPKPSQRFELEDIIALTKTLCQGYAIAEQELGRETSSNAGPSSRGAQEKTQSKSRRKPPALPKDGELPLQGKEQMRNRVMAAFIARHVSYDPRVRAFREQALGGRRLDVEQGMRFADSAATRYLPEGEFARLGIPTVDNGITCRDEFLMPEDERRNYEHLDAVYAEDQYSDWPVEELYKLTQEPRKWALHFPADARTGALRPPHWVHHPGVEALRAVLIDNPRYYGMRQIETESFDHPWRPDVVHYWPGTLAEHWYNLSQALADQYHWEFADAARYVLTHEAPPTHPISLSWAGYGFDRSPSYYGPTLQLTLSAELWVSQETIDVAWKLARKRLIGGKNTSFAESSYERLLFVVEQTPLNAQKFKWRALANDWLDRHPISECGDSQSLDTEKRTNYQRNFRSAVLAARERILGIDRNKHNSRFKVEGRFTVEQFFCKDANLFTEDSSVPF